MGITGDCSNEGNSWKGMKHTMKIYKVINIYEADFGCEGLPEGQSPKVIVHMEEASGEEKIVQADDIWLINQNIDEGSKVIIGEKGKLYPAPGNH